MDDSYTGAHKPIINILTIIHKYEIAYSVLFQYNTRVFYLYKPIFVDVDHLFYLS